MPLAITMVNILIRRVKKGLSKEMALDLDLKTRRMPGSQTARGSESQSEGTANSKILRQEIAQLVSKAVETQENEEIRSEGWEGAGSYRGLWKLLEGFK